MSNHYSAANLRFPGDAARLDLTDLFVFRAPDDPGTTVLIIDLNPYTTGMSAMPPFLMKSSLIWSVVLASAAWRAAGGRSGYQALRETFGGVLLLGREIVAAPVMVRGRRRPCRRPGYPVPDRAGGLSWTFSPGARRCRAS
jgi:hypothetical protein